MIQRLIILVIAAFALFTALRRMLARPQAGSASGNRSRSASPATGGAMVRDRICDTFVPRSAAIRLADGGGEHFFCSERCKAEHEARRAGAV